MKPNYLKTSMVEWTICLCKNEQYELKITTPTFMLKQLFIKQSRLGLPWQYAAKMAIYKMAICCHIAILITLFINHLQNGRKIYCVFLYFSSIKCMDSFIYKRKKEKKGKGKNKTSFKNIHNLLMYVLLSPCFFLISLNLGFSLVYFSFLISKKKSISPLHNNSPCRLTRVRHWSQYY